MKFFIMKIHRRQSSVLSCVTAFKTRSDLQGEKNLCNPVADGFSVFFTQSPSEERINLSSAQLSVQHILGKHLPPDHSQAFIKH